MPAVRMADPEMDDYFDVEDEKQKDMASAPYYVSWHRQSWEWYGNEDTGQGRFKPKGDGGAIVAINVPSYDEAQKIANKLDSDYEENKFYDDSVYAEKDDYYQVQYQGSNIGSMKDLEKWYLETYSDRNTKDYSKNA